mmetsp:Transcript_28966/g.38601  ORF Transcript_28966/g.38601 Transcript_28966/m.38601 type:complete len:339 (+) Transcript_28966:583-1599(+)
MAVAWHDFARLESDIDELADVFTSPVLAVLLLEVEQVVQALLIGEAMEGAGETVHACREREVGVGESRADEVSGVGRHVATFMISMDGDVEAHELPELGVGEAEHVRVVRAVVEGAIAGGHRRAVPVLVGEDEGGDAAHLRAKVKAVLKSGLPVLGLVHAALVSLHEVGLGLASHDTHGKLSHSVHVAGQRFDHALLIVAESASAEEFFLELADFRLGGKLTGEQEPQDALRDGLTTWHGRGGLVADVEELGAAVGDTLRRVQLRRLVEHAWDAAHATNNLRDSDLTDDSIGVLLSEGDDLLLAISNDLLHALAEHNGGKVALGDGAGRSLENSVHHG